MSQRLGAQGGASDRLRRRQSSSAGSTYPPLDLRPGGSRARRAARGRRPPRRRRGRARARAAAWRDRSARSAARRGRGQRERRGAAPYAPASWWQLGEPRLEAEEAVRDPAERDRGAFLGRLDGSSASRSSAPPAIRTRTQWRTRPARRCRWRRQPPSGPRPMSPRRQDRQAQQPVADHAAEAGRQRPGRVRGRQDAKAVASSTPRIQKISRIRSG